MEFVKAGHRLDGRIEGRQGPSGFTVLCAKGEPQWAAAEDSSEAADAASSKKGMAHLLCV
jgi:hypothetical protein